MWIPYNAMAWFFPSPLQFCAHQVLDNLYHYTKPWSSPKVVLAFLPFLPTTFFPTDSLTFTLPCTTTGRWFLWVEDTLVSVGLPSALPAAFCHPSPSSALLGESFPHTTLNSPSHTFVPHPQLHSPAWFSVACLGDHLLPRKKEQPSTLVPRFSFLLLLVLRSNSSLPLLFWMVVPLIWVLVSYTLVLFQLNSCSLNFFLHIDCLEKHSCLLLPLGSSHIMGLLIPHPSGRVNHPTTLFMPLCKYLWTDSARPLCTCHPRRPCPYLPTVLLRITTTILILVPCLHTRLIPLRSYATPPRTYVLPLQYLCYLPTTCPPTIPPRFRSAW